MDELEKKKMMKIRLQLGNVLYKYYDLLIDRHENVINLLKLKKLIIVKYAMASITMMIIIEMIILMVMTTLFITITLKMVMLIIEKVILILNNLI